MRDVFTLGPRARADQIDQAGEEKERIGGQTGVVLTRFVLEEVPNVSDTEPEPIDARTLWFGYPDKPTSVVDQDQDHGHVIRTSSMQLKPNKPHRPEEEAGSTSGVGASAVQSAQPNLYPTPSSFLTYWRRR